MTRLLDKKQLLEHLETCISIARDEKVALVIRNLKQEIESGSFDYGVARD